MGQISSSEDAIDSKVSRLTWMPYERHLRWIHHLFERLSKPLL